MKWIECEEFHIYDRDKYLNCPECNGRNALCIDYEGRCGNCCRRLDEGDAYCRHCGTKRGEGKFEPYSNIMQCVYGPKPQKREYECSKCGYTWERVVMTVDYHCPKCGGEARQK